MRSNTNILTVIKKALACTVVLICLSATTWVIMVFGIPAGGLILEVAGDMASDKHRREVCSLDGAKYRLTALYDPGLFVTTDRYLLVQSSRLPGDKARKTLFSSHNHDSASFTFLDDSRVTIWLWYGDYEKGGATRFRIADSLTLDLDDPPARQVIERQYRLHD